MPIKQIDHGSIEYDQMVKLRQEILRKPLNLSFESAELDREINDILIAALDEDVMLGCCLLAPMENGVVRLRQMAVQNNVQGKGIGASMMNYAENLARDKGYKKLIMHARETAVGFYEKLGYKKVGKEFTEVSLPHYIMEKILTF